MTAEGTTCRRCQQIQRGSSPAPFCRVHQRPEWTTWRQITADTRCLHCTHHGMGESPNWCNHCGHEAKGKQNDPEACVHCALYVIDAPLPHRVIDRGTTGLDVRCIGPTCSHQTHWRTTRNHAAT